MPFSGNAGNVKWGSTPADLLDVVNWSINPVSANNLYVSSDTAGAQKTTAGNTSFSITARVLQDTTTQVTDVITVGQLSNFELYENATLKWSGAARVRTMNVACDIQTGAIVGYDITWDGDGALTVPT